MTSVSPASARNEAAREAALHVLRRHGYTARDLDYLLFARFGNEDAGTESDLRQAAETLARLRGAHGC